MTSLRGTPLFLGVALLFALAVFASLSIGIRIINPFAAPDTLDAILLHAARIPRTAVAVGVGAGLGIAGAILQTVTKNVLADPGLLGINAGAAFAVVVVLSLVDAPPSLAALGRVATGGALATGALAFALAGGSRTFEAQPLRLILSGGVLAIALGSLTQIVLLLQPGAVEASQVWLAGSFADRSAQMVTVYLVPSAVLLLAGLAMAPMLSVLLVGEVQSRSLGVDVGKLRIGAFAVAAGLCGMAVSLAGPVAFVGLIAPHIGRALVGQRLLPSFVLAAASGAILVLLADVAARRLVAPAELHVGIVIAMLGVPFYMILLRRRARL